MKIITKIMIMVCVLCISWKAQAHQPDLSSTLLVEKDNNTWVLQIRASLTAFEYEVENHYGENSYMTPEEFREQVLELVEAQTSVLFNEKNAVALKNGFVKLGHETSVSFELEGPSEVMKSLEVQNRSFSDISRNQNALIVLKEGFAKDQFILDKNNGHSAKLKVGDAKFELVIPAQKKSSISYLLLGVALLGLFSLFIVFRNYPNRSFSPPLQNA